jgi:hypothetical protein
MPYTEHSDVYTAIDEEGINTLLEHLQQKRPSLFNYATERVIEAAEYAALSKYSPPTPTIASGYSPERVLCAPIERADEVLEWENPLIEEVDPLPVLGTDGEVKLDYCFQVADLSIDFSPDDPPVNIGEQQFAAKAFVCAGLACPTEEEFDRVRRSLNEDPEESELPIIPQAESLDCFCLQITIVGSVNAAGPGISGPWLEIPNTPEFRLDELIFEAEEQELNMPDGLTKSITCYIRSFIQFALLPELSEALARLEPALPPDSFLSLDLSGTRATVSVPTSSGIPNNPALEDDHLKVYADLTMSRP